MKRFIVVLFAMVVLVAVVAGCNRSVDTPVPPVNDDGVLGSAAPDTTDKEQPSETPETEKEPESSSEPEKAPEVTPEPEQTVEPTPAPEVAPEPTPEPEQTQEPEPTPEPEQTQESEPTSQPTPEVTTTPEPSVEPTPTVTPEPEPTTTPDATIEINGGSTIEPTPEPEVTPTPSQTGVSWVEGQKHSKDDVKVGATVIKADGTKVVLTATKVGNLTILGYGQGVDPYSGVVLANGTLAGEGTASWYDNTVWHKDTITGSMHSSLEWIAIESATFPGRGVTGSYEGEVRNTYWKWSTEMDQWLWIGPSKY